MTTQIHSSDHLVYSSAEELLADSGGVLQGTVTSSRQEFLQPSVEDRESDPKHPQHGLDEEEVENFVSESSLLSTLYTVEVTKEHSGIGLSVGQSAEVRLLGGVHDGVEHVWEGQATPRIGEEYFFALNQEPTADTPSSLLNRSQSIFLVSPEGYEPAEHGSGIPVIELSPEHLG